MKIEDDKFYLLKTDETHIIKTEDEAFKKIETIKNFDDVQLVEVDISDEKWKVSQVSWKKIVEHMVKKQ